MRNPLVGTLVETVAVLALGVVAGLSVNALAQSSAEKGRKPLIAGMAIGKDHFAAAPRRAAFTEPTPGATPAATTAPQPNTSKPAASAAPSPAPTPVPPATDDPDAQIVAELRKQGYQVISHPDVVKLHDSPEFAQELVVFVDARADGPYQAGHLAGAYQLDHFRPESYLPTVKPACEGADKIVVYCNGGECEDSKLATGDLMEAGIMPSRLFVYVGGVKAWKLHSLPLERGERNSNDIYKSEPETP